MQGHVYHWRHGWIPLTHYAALVKAKGNHKAAAKYLNESNGMHGSASHKLSSAERTAEAAKKGASNDAFKANIIGGFRAHGLNSSGMARNSGGGYTEGDRVERQTNDFSKPGFPMAWLPGTVDKIQPSGKYHEVHVLHDDGSRHVELVGPRGGNKNLRKSMEPESARTDAATSRAYAQRARISEEAAARHAVKNAGSMTNAEKIKAAEIMHGTGSVQHREAARRFGGHADKVSGTDQYGRSTSYEGHSVASSRATQGGKSGVVHSMHNGSDRSGLDASSRATVFVPDVNQQAGKAQAKSMSPAELKAQNQGDFRAGEKVAVKAAGGIRIASIREVAPDGRLVLHIPGHGTITRSAEDLSRKMSTATKAAEERRINGDWRKTPTPRLRSALQSSAFSAGQKAAMKAELDRRGG